MNKKYGMAALLVAGMLLFGGAAYAFMGQPFWRTDALQQAIENGDYEAWKAAINEQLTEENFNQMVQQHTQMQQRQQYMVQAAIEAGDYNAWKEAMEQLENPPLTELITEENFDLFVQMHQALQNGDFDTANQIREQLGIEGMGCGMGMRMGHRFQHEFRNAFGAAAQGNSDSGSAL